MDLLNKKKKCPEGIGMKLQTDFFLKKRAVIVGTPASSLGHGLAATNTEYDLGDKTPCPKPLAAAETGTGLAQLPAEPSAPQAGAVRGSHTPPGLCAHLGPDPTWIWVLRLLE